MAAASAIALAAPAHADVDTDFANQLHTYGIYGQRDYNAWLGKIACERFSRGVDTDAFKSANFILNNLPQHTTTGQAWQFLGAAISAYCPEQTPILQRAAEQPIRYLRSRTSRGLPSRSCIVHTSRARSQRWGVRCDCGTGHGRGAESGHRSKACGRFDRAGR
jgi:hypothetical protein